MVGFFSFSQRAIRAVASVATVAVLAACHAGALTPAVPGGAPEAPAADRALLHPAGISNNNPATVFRGVGNFVDGLAYGPHGELYVADGNASIAKITPDGAISFIASTIAPNTIAVDGLGDVFVAQTNAGMTGKGIIEKITPDGTIVRIGNRRWIPYSLAADAVGNLYIVQRHDVSKVTPDGKTSTIGQGFRAPVGVAVDAAGNVYIADVKAQSIKRVAPNGAITPIGHGLVNPSGVAVDGRGNVYVMSQAIPVAKISPNGTIRPVATGLGVSSAIAADASGNLAAGRTNPGAVVTVAPNGTIASPLKGAPNGITTSFGGSIYVTDAGDNNVYRVFPDGRIATVGSGFYQPTAVAVDAKGNVYVGDMSASLYRVSSSGRTTLVASKLWVHALAFNAKGDLYVGSIAGVSRLGRNGKLIGVSGGFYDLQCLAFDKAGTLYVGDMEKLVKVAPNGQWTTVSNETTLSVAINKGGRIWGSFSGGLYVLDKNGNRITSSRFPVIGATAVAFDRAGNLYVVNQLAGVVQKFIAQ